MQSLPGETLSRRFMRYIAESDLIFMDATPAKFQHPNAQGVTEDKWFTNPGILIEYAIAVALGRGDDIKVYCLVSPNNLHQFLREKIVDPYPVNDEAAFLRYIDQIVIQREADSPRLLRQSRIRASFTSLYPEI